MIKRVANEKFKIVSRKGKLLAEFNTQSAAEDYLASKQLQKHLKDQRENNGN